MFRASYGPATPEFEDFREGLIAHHFLDTIAVGDVIMWTNTDVVMHTVDSGVVSGGVPMGDDLFDAEMLPGESICLRFDTAGTFPYFCDFHPTQMQGTVTVE